MDVKKGAVTLEKLDATYKQSWKVLSGCKAALDAKAAASYQVLVPYLKEFETLNPGSLAIHECDDSNHLTRVFVCPGIMTDTLRFVRPVISIDAAHMKTTAGGGTLYIASVKSASNDIYPVAISLMVDNENKEGWVWFLENLRSCVPNLDADHRKECVAYKRFTFISDRQKGLMEALKAVFPENHACFCAIHIARNVEVKFGVKHGKFVVPLAKTFSSYYAGELVQSMGVAARAYVEEIEAPQWRSQAWLRDESLPPRYGIVTSNMSEVTNSMFEKARDVPWKSCIHMILSKMVERIGDLSEKYKDKTGVVQEVENILRTHWDDCSGMSIVAMNGENGEVFTVFEPARGPFAVESIGYNMNVLTKACDCGLWQEHGYPCVHAVAFLKKHRNVSFEALLEEVCPEYTYESNHSLFKRNFLTVCVDKVEMDTTILAPLFKKRKAGRPKKKRYRKRSRVSTKSNETSTSARCSRCGIAGHNVRTCVARQANAEDEMVRAEGGQVDIQDVSVL